MRARFWLLLLLFLAQFLNYFDRVTFAAVAPVILNEFALSPKQFGFALSAFFAVYTLSCLVGGWLVDRLSARRVMGWFVPAWSLLSALHAGARSFAGLVVLRVLFGAGEGPSGAATTVLVGRWFDDKKRATVLALVGVGAPLGGLGATPVSGLLASKAGWRAPFLLTGLLGVAWALAWMLAYRGQGTSPYTEVAREPAPMSTISARPSIRPLVGLACSFFGYSYLLFFFLSWFPTYLSLGLHLDLRQATVLGSIPWSCGVVGLVTGGVASDHLVNLVGPLAARRSVIAASLGGTAVAVLFAGFAEHATLAALAMAMAVFLLYMSGSVFYASALELSPGRPGLAVGFVQLIGNAAGLVAPAATGMLVGSGHNFRAAFIATFAVAVAGLLALLIGQPNARADDATVPGSDPRSG